MTLNLEDFVPVVKQAGLNTKKASNLAGVTIDKNGNVVVPGNLTVSGISFADNEATTITSADSNALAVGANGATNPVLQIDASAATIASGVKIVGNAAGSGTLIQAISSNGTEQLTLASKSTAAVVIRPGADSISAIFFQNGGASANKMRFDTTNGRMRLGDGNTPSSTLDVGGDITLSAHNIVTDTTTGIKIGTATTQKLGFYNATPVVQPAASADVTSFVAGVGTASKSDSTWTGASGSSAYTVGGIVTQLKALGLLAA